MNARTRTTRRSNRRPTDGWLDSYSEWKVQFLKKVNEDAEACDALTTLSHRCDVGLLLLCIGQLVGHGPFSDDWRGLIGFDRRSLQTVAQRFRQCGDDLERLNSSILGRFLYQPNVAWAPRMELVPQTLRECAAFILKGPGEFRQQPTHHPVRTVIRAFLIAHVLERTLRPCDRQLSALYNVAVGKTIDTASWRQWRLAHTPLIEHLRRIPPTT